MTKSYRIESIDILRGLVMVLMAMDHTRDFFASSGLNPRDVNDTLVFMTRWITHLCAPTFIFLGGVAIYLWQDRHTREETSRFIFTRGLWLILLEFTLVKLGWTFNITPSFMMAQVIWVIGLSMVVMSVVIYLPLRIIALVSAVMIFGHNIFDSIEAVKLGSFKWLWMFLHEPGMLYPWSDARFFVVYPMIPWVAVMSAGYCFGAFFLQPKVNRMRWILVFGIASVTSFIILRFTNIYGDPAPWIVQDTIVATLLSFINCEKYPPSLLYLLMTLGLAFLLLVLFENVRCTFSIILMTFGRVPLFFYILHIPIIHFVAVVVAVVRGEEFLWLFNEPFFSKPADYGYNLGVVYVVWLCVVAGLYPVCRAFEIFKRKQKRWWLRYL